MARETECCSAQRIHAIRNTQQFTIELLRLVSVKRACPLRHMDGTHIGKRHCSLEDLDIVDVDGLLTALRAGPLLLPFVFQIQALRDKWLIALVCY
jgi:hypothetical protein